MDVQVRLGTRVRMLRRDAGLTQRQAADLAGLSVAVLRDLEQGRVRAPRPATLRRLTEALRLDPAGTEELLRCVHFAAPGRDLWLQVLGPVAVRVAGAVVDIGSARRRRLLATLALAANTPVSHDRLIETIWGNRPPVNVAKHLRLDTSRLRRQLAHPGGSGSAPYLVAVAGGYQLMVSPDQLDLLQFRRLVDHARRARADGDPARACRLLAEAAALWRGEPMADLAPLRQDPMVVGLVREWQAAVVAYAETAIELGRHEEVLSLLRRVVEADPLHEPAYAQLMIALADGGQPAAALRMFTTLRRRLTARLGTDPSPELLTAYQLVRARDGAQRDAPAVTVRRRLPPDLADFTGRAAELRILHERVAAPAGGTAVRVLAITGLGGSGKTRLAVRLAHQLLASGRCLDTQLYVDLRGHAEQPPAEPAAVLAALLGLLGVRRDQIPPDLPSRTALYRDRLYGKAALVLLDGAAGPEQVLPLLPAGPTNLVLVTSRRSLALDGAYALPLDGFAPADAERLLARIAGPDRIAGDPAAVRRLVALCGYHPLAVSLAGRRLRARPTWRPADLAARLESTDRLGELAAGSDQLRAVFDLSYRRLDHAERRLLRLLGAEPGEVSAESAGTLAGVPPLVARRMLDRLVEEHLASAVAGERYQLPELLRAFARTA